MNYLECIVPMEVSQLMVNIQYSVKSLPQCSYIKMNDLRKTVYVGNPKPKRNLFLFCLHFRVHNSTYSNVVP